MILIGAGKGDDELVSNDSAPQRDPQAVSKFIERYAADLVESGVPRQPARVFVALLASDSGRLTTAELAEILRLSPAAISGAVRYLTQVKMIGREREPGSRRDHFVMWDDDWYEMAMRRDQFLSSWMASLREGVDALGTDTPAGTRVAETLAFIEFLHEEMPVMLEKWRKRRDELRAARDL
jgi:predicted transcriptional regulator